MRGLIHCKCVMPCCSRAICRGSSFISRMQYAASSFIIHHLFVLCIRTPMLIWPVPIQISLAPPGTQACTLDIAKFHRTCPVLPSHKPWLVVQGRDGDFYIDHAFPFGAASASSNAGMIANAAVDIWLAESVAPICKYEDDLKNLPHPLACRGLPRW